MACLSIITLVLALALFLVRTSESQGSVSHVDIIGYGPRYIKSQEINLLPYNPLYPIPQPQIPVVNKYIPFTLYDLYNVPFYYMIKSAKPKTYTMYYAKNGVRTAYENDSFKALFQYLKTPSQKNGVLFHTKFTFSQKLLEFPIDSTVYPDNFTMAEYAEYAQACSNIPTLLIYSMPEELGLDEKNTYNVAALKVYGEYIDLVVANESHKPKQEKVIKVVNISDDQTKTSATI